MENTIIISDSHGKLDNVRKIAEKEKDVDAVIHLGDLIGQDEQLAEIFETKIYKVRGNCDFTSENPLSQVVEFGKNRILITHGHNLEQTGCVMRLWKIIAILQCMDIHMSLKIQYIVG